MKFERPKDIFLPLKPIKMSDGNVVRLNPKKFDEIYTEEYNNRIRFLDLALTIEDTLSELYSQTKVIIQILVCS